MQSIVHRLRSALLPFTVVLLTTPIALAQAAQGADEPAGYYANIEHAVRAYDMGQWSEASAAFERAHAISPNARTLRGLALTAYKLRHYVDSERHIEAALASGVKPLTEAQGVELLQLREWAQRSIGHVELKLQPPGAHAQIDGVEATSASTALDSGEHLLTVRAAGHVTQQQRFVIEGGRPVQIHVSLLPIEVRPRLASKPHAAAQDSSSLFASPWLWTAVGVVAAGAVVFAVTREGDVKQQPHFTGGAAVLIGPSE
jgi:hypothetical protein